jgi:hypothetical protein
MDIYLDKSRSVRLLARVNEDSVPRTLVFVDEAGNPVDISALDFELHVFKRSNSTQKLFTLTIGDGLEVTGDDNNQLEIEISQARATQKPDTYFWRLHSTAENHTWLNGPFIFHMGESDNVEEEESVNIYQNG